MRIDYRGIKQLAEEVGCRVTDLVALSPQNDPFYIGPARRLQAEWFAELWMKLNFKEGSHLRRLHYILVSQPEPVLKPHQAKTKAATWLPYENSENDWSLLVSASLAARYLRLIPDNALSDHRNDEPILNALRVERVLPHAWAQSGVVRLSYSIERSSITPPYMFANSGSVAQRYLVEVWIEKSTMNDILLPLASKLDFNLVPGIGETSEIRTREAFDRAVADGRPVRILYISDFDPAGRSMPVAMARKLEFWISQAGANIDLTLNPIALTPQQCAHYRLPRTPIKETEKRAAKFEERFGSGATELDALEALHPGELGRIVQAEVTRYIDTSLRSRVFAANSDFTTKVNLIEREIWNRYETDGFEQRYNELIDLHEDVLRDQVELLQAEMQPAWEAIAEEIQDSLPEFSGEFPEPKIAAEPKAPLFDSKRDYVDQIDHYRAWQGKGGAG